MQKTCALIYKPCEVNSSITPKYRDDVLAVRSKIEDNEKPKNSAVNILPKEIGRKLILRSLDAGIQRHKKNSRIFC